MVAGTTALVKHSLNPSNDEIVALQGGCDFAAYALVRRWEPTIERMARRHARPGCSHDELVQAGRIALWRAARGFSSKNGTAFDHYARCAIRNAFRHELRANPGVPQPDLDEDVPDGPADDTYMPPAAQLALAEARQAIAVHTMDLPDRLRNVFAVLYGCGFTQRRAAEELEVSQPRVAQLRARLVRALQTPELLRFDPYLN